MDKNKDIAIIEGSIKQIELKTVAIVLKNEPSISNDIIGIICDIVKEQSEKLISNSGDNTLNIEIPFSLNNNKFKEDLVDIGKCINLILKTDNIDIITMSSYLIERISGVQIFIEKIKNGDMFNVDHILKKIGNIKIHEDYNSLIDSRLLSVEDDEKNIFKNAINNDNYADIKEIINQSKQEYEPHGFNLEMLAIVDNEMLSDEEYSKLEKPLLDGVYIRIVKDKKVFLSKWVKDFRALLEFLENSISMI